jgi:GntR family transcriptional regulator
VEVRIDPSAPIPVWVQLRRSLASAVEDGRLRPGDRLPTVRELATRLGVAPNTVAKVYRSLGDAAVIVGRGRRGTFVADAGSGAVDPIHALRVEADRYADRAAALGVSEGEALGELRGAFARRAERTSGSGSRASPAGTRPGCN